ncbi:DUF456 domain-containing protein [Polymorphospora rubra]|uniref:DUF456 domain-containing protein n=1 Tax=Polymorphospora rubra TaxID=338584 RepID=UPI0033C62898
MNLAETDTLVTFIAGVAIVIGILGVIVPVLPGLPLCWGGVLLWAIFADGGWGKWVVLAVATVIAVVGAVVQYSWPGRNLKRSGVPNRTLLIGGLLGLVGFFVVPVVGLILGFVLGVWLAERMRLGDNQSAWPSTKNALKAAGLSMLIELGAALGIAFVWVVGLIVA